MEKNEFLNYAKKHLGISSMELYYWEKLQDSIYSKVMVSNSVTPMILEERELRATLMSVFDRMMGERIIWAVGVVNEQMSTIIQAQLMYLDSISKDDVTIQINSPGGSVLAGLSMIDVMNYVACDIKTINVGMAASMGSVLLGAGTKGKRFSLPNSKVMLHSVSSGAEGTIQELRISLAETEKYNTKLFNMLGEYCGKDPEQVKKDADRDFWMTSEESKEYGIIDDIIISKKSLK